MKIAITAETTIDLSEELKQKFDIKLIPFEITLGDKSYFDGDLSSADLFDYVEKTGTLPKTNAVNEYRYNEFFTDVLKEYDAIIHFCLSSKISATYQNAVAASKNFENIYVVDTCSLSTGIALLAINAAILRETIDDPKKIFEIISARAPKVQASFVVHRLDYLHKGGRCSSLQLLGANLLKIRPQIILKDGTMSVHKKYRGNMTSVIQKYCKDTLDEFNTPDKKMAFVTYSTATPDMIREAKEALKDAGFENIYETQAKATICSHCGELTLGILYINDAVPMSRN